MEISYYIQTPRDWPSWGKGLDLRGQGQWHKWPTLMPRPQGLQICILQVIFTGIPNVVKECTYIVFDECRW